MHCFFGTIIGAKSKHVYRQMLNITRNMGCTHLARVEPLFSVFIIRRDTQFLIPPLERVGIRKVTQHSIWVVPEAPENPEPHGRTEELGLDHLGSGQLRELSVPRLDVRTSASPTWQNRRVKQLALSSSSPKTLWVTARNNLSFSPPTHKKNRMIMVPQKTPLA